MMNGCVMVDWSALWAGVIEGVVWAVGAFLFVGGLIGILGWRRPTHMAWLHNKLMLGLILLIAVPAGFLALMGSISLAFSVDEACVEAGQWWLQFLDPNSEWNTAVVVLPTAIVVICASFYFFKAARPAFLVAKTGNQRVDEAVVRYRKAGEEAFIGRPRLVVDGVGYYQVLYLPEGPEGEEAAEFLILREDGQVVEDEALAVRVMRVGNAALELGDPEQMHHRWWMYREGLPKLARALQKVEGQLRQMLKGARQLGKYEKIREDLRRLQRVLVVMEPFVERQRKDLEVLARWSWKKGGPKMKELSEEEVEAIEEELQALRYWMEDEGRIRVMEEGEAAWRRLREWLRGPGGRRLAEEEPWTYEFLEELVGIWEEEEGFGIPREAWEKARRGELRWFKPGDEGDLAAWRRRLAWVREVEGRRAREQEARRVQTTG